MDSPINSGNYCLLSPSTKLIGLLRENVNQHLWRWKNRMPWGISREIRSACYGLKTGYQLNGSGITIIVFGIPATDSTIYNSYIQIGQIPGRPKKWIHFVLEDIAVEKIIPMPRKSIDTEDILPRIGNSPSIAGPVSRIVFGYFHIFFKSSGTGARGMPWQISSSRGTFHILTFLSKGVNPTGRCGDSKFSNFHPKCSITELTIESDTALKVCVFFIPSFATRTKAFLGYHSQILTPLPNRS